MKLYKQGLDKLVKTQVNCNKFILKCFSNCSPPVKSGFVQHRSYSFWRNWVLEKWSLSSAVIFRAVFLWSFLTIRVRVERSLSDSFRFLPEFCFSEEFFPSYSNGVIIFVTVLLTTSNNWAVFVTLVPAIRAPTIRLLLKSDRSAILINFD